VSSEVFPSGGAFLVFPEGGDHSGLCDSVGRSLIDLIRTVSSDQPTLIPLFPVPASQGVLRLHVVTAYGTDALPTPCRRVRCLSGLSRIRTPLFWVTSHIGSCQSVPRLAGESRLLRLLRDGIRLLQGGIEEAHVQKSTSMFRIFCPKKR